VKQIFDNFVTGLIIFGLVVSSAIIIFQPNFNFFAAELIKETPAIVVETTPNNNPYDADLANEGTPPAEPDRNLILGTLEYVIDNSIRLATFQGVTVKVSNSRGDIYYGYSPGGIEEDGTSFAWTVDLDGEITNVEELAGFNYLPIAQLMVNTSSFLNNIGGIQDLKLGKGDISFAYLNKAYITYFEGGFLTNLLILNDGAILEDILYEYEFPEQVKELAIPLER
jgi:hypothetical protein